MCSPTSTRHSCERLPCRLRRIVSRLRSRVLNKTLRTRAALSKPWRRKSRSCAGSLKSQLVASQECNVAEERAAMLQQNLEEEAGYGQTDCRKMKQQAMAKRPECSINPRDFVVADAHTPHCGPLLLPHCTPVRPRVEAPREMTMHLLPFSPPPAWVKCFPIPAATGAPPNLPPQWWCSIAQCIAHRASTPEARWPQINPRGRCLGLQTPHCCTCAGPHARASPIALPVVPAV